MVGQEKIEQLSKDFDRCRKILIALGDENRQHMILEMMRTGDCTGLRVNAITEKTHLSRPAVSHHLQILKEAGILKMRREGTKNYYYFNSEQESMDLLIHVLKTAQEITRNLPDRSGKENF